MKMVLVSLMLAMIVGICAAIFLVRDVSTGIKSIVTPMQALGGGDLAAIVPHQEEKNGNGRRSQQLAGFQGSADCQEGCRQSRRDRMPRRKFGAAKRVNAITRDFEALIGDIVATVSSASTGLEASAGTLTSAAERSQKLTIVVAAASRKRSTNIQSVASATEEMSSSRQRDQPPGARVPPICQPGRRCRHARPTTASANW